MSKLIGILIIVAMAWVASQVSKSYNKAKRQTDGPGAEEKAAAAKALPDLPTPQLEQALQQAMAGGTATFKAWIDKYGMHAPEPRRSAIELDYAMMLSRTNPGEAKRVLALVKARVAPDSPVYDRVVKMEKAFK